MRLFIAEKPSVAKAFAKALGIAGVKSDGYIESKEAIVTWCVGHLVTMSYPEKYDEKYRRWSLDTLPFIPETFRYEVIDSVKKQYDIVSGLLNREDVDCIYICTDSGREGEYIYRLVDEMAKVASTKQRRRVWIDSQTEEEILRGIENAKDWKEYDHLAASAYLRAKEDYLMGINFSRLLTLRYGNTLASLMKKDRIVLSVGRVMTCVVGMVVKREREIRDFVKTSFYRVLSNFSRDGVVITGEWRAVEGSKYFQSPKLYRENGFKKEEDAKVLIDELRDCKEGVVLKTEKKKEVKNPPLLYNLAEIQNECSKRFKIRPDETLQIIQELYEKKLVTYPRTDARVLSTAVAKEIGKNISGLCKVEAVADFAKEVMGKKTFLSITKSKYVNDKQITDHYAIIPTGQGLYALEKQSPLARKVYELICRRFLSIFYPPAIYQKDMIEIGVWKEHFFVNTKVCVQRGYLAVAEMLLDESGEKKSEEERPELIAMVTKLKKGDTINVAKLYIKEGETTPPKRYSSGSMILAMENAGQLIEDEELRSHIKGSGIGTSATRADILKKLVNIKYLGLNKKTQAITPTQLGEMVYEVVLASIAQLLNPELTASWEKGLNYVAQGSITQEEYMQKLDTFVRRRTYGVMQKSNQYLIREAFDRVSKFYKK
ncbi:MAG: type IA DNA topoisomerase [Lachnoanaerobaculum sp.]|nr:MAG: type IA DNA topoisomerase [Lachnoanaerobaculum sp.]